MTISKKLRKTEVERFLKSTSDLNSASQIMLPRHSRIWNFSRSFKFYFKFFQKTLKLPKLWKYWILKEIGENYSWMAFTTDKSVGDTLKNVKKWRKIYTTPKNFDIFSYVSIQSFCKNWNFRVNNEHLPVLKLCKIKCYVFRNDSNVQTGYYFNFGMDNVSKKFANNESWKTSRLFFN